MGLVPPDLGLPLRLRVNDGSLSPGETLTLTVTALPASTALVVDLYIALQLPDQRVWFLRSDGSITPEIQPYLQVAGVRSSRGGFPLHIDGRRAYRNLRVAGRLPRPRNGDARRERGASPIYRQPIGHATQRHPSPPSVLWGRRGAQHVWPPGGRPYELPPDLEDVQEAPQVSASPLCRRGGGGEALSAL